MSLATYKFILLICMNKSNGVCYNFQECSTIDIVNTDRILTLI